MQRFLCVQNFTVAYLKIQTVIVTSICIILMNFKTKTNEKVRACFNPTKYACKKIRLFKKLTYFWLLYKFKFIIIKILSTK